MLGILGLGAIFVQVNEVIYCFSKLKMITLQLLFLVCFFLVFFLFSIFKINSSTSPYSTTSNIRVSSSVSNQCFQVRTNWKLSFIIFLMVSPNGVFAIKHAQFKLSSIFPYNYLKISNIYQLVFFDMSASNKSS